MSRASAAAWQAQHPDENRARARAGMRRLRPRVVHRWREARGTQCGMSIERATDEHGVILMTWDDTPCPAGYQRCERCWTQKRRLRGLSGD